MALNTPLNTRSASPLVPGETLPQMFWNAARQRSARVGVRQKEFGFWCETTWAELAMTAEQVGMGLCALGFMPGETASILSNTRREWTEADLAILGAGGVSAGIYPTDAVAQVEYLLGDSASRCVFVEDDEQLDKVLQVRDRLPALKWIVVFDMKGLTHFSDPMLMSLEDLRLRGEAYGRDRPQLWPERLDCRRTEDLAVLIYTSGTTGKPKGAMLSHRNILVAVRGMAPLVPQNEDDDRICFLPLCHALERILGQFYSLYTGSVMNFVENPETVAENVREIQPTIFIAVPRIWEKFHSAVSLRMREAMTIERWCYERALALGLREVERRLAGQPVPLLLALACRIARRLVLTNIRKVIGLNRTRFIGSGGAPISPELLRWFMALGLDVGEGYGMTESTAVIAFTPPRGARIGTVGPPVPWSEVRLSEQGEIHARGEHVFMGYLNQPEKTAETVIDGWLHTGDVGAFDEAGYLRIIDRIKDIIITAGGKNITPSEIENEIKSSPYITDAVVIGDRREYLTCLVMIDYDNVVQFAQESDIPFTDFCSLCRAREVQDLIQLAINGVNQQFARVEQVKKFRLIEVKLTAEDEELTPTMKLKRKLVNEKYQELIEEMYRH
jgi:long-chain acyl-CoA synthetase